MAISCGRATGIWSMPSKAGDLRMQKKELDDRIVRRVDKFLFRLQSQLLAGLLPGLRKLADKERKFSILGVAGGNKEKEELLWKQQ
jgi:predicted nuclease with RNAse H fold